jgi:SAM-dependent methyltransferase
LPCAYNGLDLVVSQFGVMYFSDRRKAYSEAHKSLKPGGILLFNTWDSFDYNPVARMTQDIIAGFFPLDTPVFYLTPFSYFDEITIREDLAFAGFQQVGIETLSLTGFAETPEIAARGLLRGTPVSTAILERDADLLPEIEAVLAERLSLHFGNANLQVPIQAKVVTAVK